MKNDNCPLAGYHPAGMLEPKKGQQARKPLACSNPGGLAAHRRATIPLTGSKPHSGHPTHGHARILGACSNCFLGD